MSSLSLPWFMFDMTNYQLITSPIIPGDISDSKQIILTEVPIPGLNYAPVQSAGNGNRKISFTIPLIKRNNSIGNSLLLAQFHALRNQGTGLTSVFSNQFKPNPKVLYYWGTGSVPLIYYVSKCDFSHKKGWVNRAGVPQVSEVNIELILDENNTLYQAEEVFRKAAGISQSVIGVVDTALGASY